MMRKGLIVLAALLLCACAAAPAPHASLDLPYVAEGGTAQPAATPTTAPKENIRDRLGLPRTAFASARDTASLY